MGEMGGGRMEGVACSGMSMQVRGRWEAGGRMEGRVCLCGLQPLKYHFKLY